MKRFIIVLTFIVVLPITVFSYPKKALIFGVTGQDGTYLSEFLLERGYEVHGVHRNSSLSNTVRVDYLLENLKYKDSFFLHYGDLTDAGNIVTLVEQIDPDEIYNLASQSQVRISFDMPEYTADVGGLGVLRILDAIKKTGRTKKIKFYQASTSEMFGKAQEIPQTESTPFYPRSPYGIAKLFGYWTAVNYRESYGIFACNGILFNHESPLRGETFVTRKISLAVAKKYLGMNDAVLFLGNLDARRDWGYAKDYVEAIWLIMQQDRPDDYVIATGQSHTVREFVELAFKEINITISWKGTGVDEIGFDKATGKVLVKIDPYYFRPAECDVLIGNAKKMYEALKWKPVTTFSELVTIMVQEDIKMLRRQCQKGQKNEN